MIAGMSAAVAAAASGCQAAPIAPTAAIAATSAGGVRELRKGFLVIDARSSRIGTAGTDRIIPCEQKRKRPEGRF
jgi:deoxyribose-phosphate aldolase